MRLLAVTTAVALLTIGSLGALQAGSVPLLPHVSGVTTPALSEHVATLVPAISLGDEGQAQDTRDVVDIVSGLYGRFGLPDLSAEQRFQMQAQLDVLDPLVARSLQRLLGALELSAVDTNRPQAAARLLATLDDVRPLLEAAAQDVAPEASVALFPGPNSGLLFNDPFNLILIGGPGNGVIVGSNYWAVLPEANLLTIELGGDDTYYAQAGTARPLPDWVCGPCHGGVPVSVTLDVGGNDRYTPTSPAYAALGFGAGGGVGVLVDVSGNDRYIVGTGEGRGANAGIGLLIDVAGDDTFQGGAGSQGFSGDAGSLGVFIDLQGRDTYSSSSWSRGYAFPQSTAIFLDACGTDSYSNFPGANGAMWQQTTMGYGADGAFVC